MSIAAPATALMGCFAIVLPAPEPECVLLKWLTPAQCESTIAEVEQTRREGRRAALLVNERLVDRFMCREVRR